MTTDKQKFREEILSRLDTAPALPGSAVRVMAMLQDPEVEVKGLLEVLEFDPGLTANLLRWANSAYFSGPQRVASVRDAVVRLGMKRMAQLVMTSVTASIIDKPVTGYDLPPGGLLLHSIAVAIGTQELARVLDVAPPPHAFTAGLLHDIGKMILGSFVEVNGVAITEYSKVNQVPFDAAEREVLGIDHAEVGAALLTRWNLPETIVSVVRWHHEPAKFEGDPLALDLVQVANVLGREGGLATGPDGLQYRPDETALKRLKVKPMTLEHVLACTLEGVSGIRDALSVTSTQ